MRQSTAILIASAISVSSLAAILVILLDIWSGDGSSAAMRSSASYIGSPVSAIVFAILFLGGGAIAAWARSTAAALAVLPTLGLAFAPVVLGFREGLNVPHGAIVAFAGAFDVDGATVPCPPGWSVVPELAGKMPLGAGIGTLDDGAITLTERILGADGGEENHMLTADEMPSHDHGYRRVSIGQAQDLGVVLGGPRRDRQQISDYDDRVSGQGGGLTHNNMPPYLVVQFCSLD